MLTALFIVFIFSTGSGQEKNPGRTNHMEQDWPQWRGPDRDGHWELDLDKKTLIPEDLRKVWEVPVGTGYCGPTVSEGKLYLMDYQGDSLKRERVLCFEAATGIKVWEYAYKSVYSRVGYPTGPRASVLVEGGKAYSFGTMGDLHCLDAETGEVLWNVQAVEDYNAAIPVWGLASSPLIEEDLLIVQLGGQPDACLVAFHKNTGKEAWRALPDQASYSAPIVIDQAGRRVLVCWTGENVAGLDPLTGEVYWKIIFERGKGIINIATPVHDPPFLFVSSFWDGSMLIRLEQDSPGAELVWRRAGRNERFTDALHCCISTPLIQGNYVYGVDSYGEFRCLEKMTGDRVWADSTLVPYGRWANAHLIRQGKNMWAFNELGELILGRLSPAGFSESGRVKLLDPVPVSPNPRGGVNWAHPAFAGRYIFARSDARLVCYRLLK
jgi:outer membrane protein assembly factor BamB